MAEGTAAIRASIHRFGSARAGLPDLVLALCDALDAARAKIASTDSALADQYNAELVRRLTAEAQVAAVRALIDEVRDVYLGVDTRWTERVRAALDGAVPPPAAIDRRDEHGKLPEDYEYGDDGHALVPDEPCPDCGNDPNDDTLHRDGCRRIDSDTLQCGPPWLPWPEDADPPPAEVPDLMEALRQSFAKAKEEREVNRRG